MISANFISPRPMPSIKPVYGRITLWILMTLSSRPCYFFKTTRMCVLITKENFDNLSEDQKMQGPMPRFESSTFSFGKAKVGTQIHATYTMKNEGKSCFCVYKLDVDACCYSHSDIPAADPGEKISFRVHLDTKDMPKGECLKIVTLTTNSPLRPIVNLFISGILE